MASACGTCVEFRGRSKGSRCRGQRVWGLEEMVVLTYVQK